MHFVNLVLLSIHILYWIGTYNYEGIKKVKSKEKKRKPPALIEKIFAFISPQEEVHTFRLAHVQSRLRLCALRLLRVFLFPSLVSI